MSAGFYGKLPARGDFVRGGLSTAVVDALDDWMRACLHASQDSLGESWVDCWMEAPVWRFFATIGGQRLGGVWMPSMDSVERCFPLVIATDAARAGPAWLAGAEALGFDAVTTDVTPDRLALRLVGIAPDPWTPPARDIWWTDGAPRKAAARFECDDLPDPATFAAFLTDQAPEPPA
ncbi:MAG: type VI secretion-associated protein [Acidiphilium sp. 37-64-53]|uniref:type VI secretion system-associated protein TagF n=1 Tax=Acidiphilium TaxID=522 RepID=UPI000BC6AFA8|nr:MULTISPECIES: type VI secretion system-associated protein TagF [Acidiphilium]OYW01792.1 MAG: type VI secretion-associated protein [Acidiphilium sp. 37-64-53]OZB27336.1 MAG: type VI secretion-associated protein [Acidiphilium sp. 34-64-41]HQT85675.1 type VI secretion system-associated protein TagF [Acidiphilium rubrum]